MEQENPIPFEMFLGAETPLHYSPSRSGDGSIEARIARSRSATKTRLKRSAANGSGSSKNTQRSRVAKPTK